MHVIITGATGFIGKALCEKLVEKKYEVIALSRSSKKSTGLFDKNIKVVEWDGKTSKGWSSYVDGASAIINLAGENVGSGYWTKTKKQKILESRVNAGKAVVSAIENAKKKPEVLIQASAIGYYGSRKDELLDESSSIGTGFLADVSREWEAGVKKVESLGVRFVIIRTGVVLGSSGGALARLLPPFKFFLGGPVGDGKQWFSWIHINDEISAICFLMENKNLNGAFNLTSQNPLMMEDFCKVLGKAINRPSWLRVPGFILHLLLGEMADEMLLSGQRVIPKRLLESGFKFQYSEIDSALQEILG